MDVFSYFILFIILLVAIISAIRNQLVFFVSASFFLAIFVPYEVFSIPFYDLFLGTISPFALYVIAFSFIYMFLRPSFAGRILMNSYSLPLLILLCFVAGLTYFQHGFKGFGTIVDNYLSVFLFCSIVTLGLDRINPSVLRYIFLFFVLAMVYGLVENVLNYNPLYGWLFLQTIWSESQWGGSIYRSASTIGHPLICATLYLMFYVSFKSYVPYKNLLALLVFLSILSTGSRAGVFVFLFYFIIINVSFRDIGRFAILVLSTSVLLWIFNFFGAFDNFIYRLQNSEGSDSVRLALLEVIYDIFSEKIIGGGIGSTGDYTDAIGFHNAVESAWISLIIEIGLVGLVVLFSSYFLFLKSNNILRSNYGLIFVTIMMVSTFNSIAVHTPIFFIFVSLSMMCSHNFYIKSSS